MGKFTFTIMISLMVMLITAACSAESVSPTQDQKKPVNVFIRSVPNPSAMGDVEFSLNIQDDQGEPIEAAIVDVSIEHTDMSGMEMNGIASQQSPGNYAITANFSMSGNWKMTVFVRKNGLDYQEEIFLKVE